jgi:hypothetical protein
MSEQRALVLRKGFIASCALAALVLLASFYSIVEGAVERAARQRVAARQGSAPTTTIGTTARQQQQHANALFARVAD